VYSYDRRSASRGYVVHPHDIIRRALGVGLLTPAEATSTKIQHAAQSAAEELRESWPEGEGFGSSDMTFVMQDMLNNAGIPTEFRNNRLERKDSAGKTARGVTAALDTGLAKAYADAWSPALIGKNAPKYIGAAHLGEMLWDHWVHEVAMKVRTLQYRSSSWMAPSELAAQMALLCPEYNSFHAGKVCAFLARFPGVEVQPAREYSVCLYVKGDPDPLQKIASAAKAFVHADEVDYQDDGSLRLWWD
jgi:hypothetical protein